MFRVPSVLAQGSTEFTLSTGILQKSLAVNSVYLDRHEMHPGFPNERII